MRVRHALLVSALAAALSACAPPQGVRTLHFQPAAPGTPLTPERLLLDQRVPEDQLLSIPEALRRAPDGSVIVVCNDALTLTNFWGVCSHVSRKLAPGLLTDSPGFLDGGVQTRPERVLYGRAAVIVLDVGVREDQLPALRAEAQRLNGTPYRLGTDGGLDCTTYQNALQRHLGLPDIAARNPSWFVWLPQDTLTGPAVRRVLWVGMRDHP